MGELVMTRSTPAGTACVKRDRVMVLIYFNSLLGEKEGVLAV